MSAALGGPRSNPTGLRGSLFHEQWVKRSIGAAVAFGIVFGVMVLLGMGPRPVLVAALVGLASAILCLMLDISDRTETAKWYVAAHRVGRGRGADLRVNMIRRRLSDSMEQNDFGNQLHPMLVDLIDDRLRSEHGIDRSTDPVAARIAMGDALADFVEDPPTAAQLSKQRYLTDIITRMEQL